MDESNLYWRGGALSTQIRGMPKAPGASPTTFYDHKNTVLRLRIVGSTIYFNARGAMSNDWPLFSISTSGGGVTVYGDIGRDGWIDGDKVFWPSANYSLGLGWVNEYSLSARMGISWAQFNSAYLANIRVVGKYLYWTQGSDNEHPAHTIYSTLKATYRTSPRYVCGQASNPLTRQVLAMTDDGVNMYWIDFKGYGVYKFPVAVAYGCGGETQLATSRYQPTSVATDGVHVYWAGTGVGAGIWRVPVNGGPTETVVEYGGTYGIYQDLIVDDTHVYYIQGMDIKRIVKNP
jgi:hypothetical protein